MRIYIQGASELRNLLTKQGVNHAFFIQKATDGNYSLSNFHQKASDGIYSMRNFKKQATNQGQNVNKNA